MEIIDQINQYLHSLEEEKRKELNRLHQDIMHMMPGCRLWYLDGRDETGKVVSNPNIGYGQYQIQYKNGTSKEFYQVGISSNTSGISVYIMGLGDKAYLPTNYGEKIGKAKVTGYCISFKKLEDINPSVLEEAIRNGVEQTNTKG